MYFQEKWSNSTKTGICFEAVKNMKIYLNSKKMDFQEKWSNWRFFQKFWIREKIVIVYLLSNFGKSKLVWKCSIWRWKTLGKVPKTHLGQSTNWRQGNFNKNSICLQMTNFLVINILNLFFKIHYDSFLWSNGGLSEIRRRLGKWFFIY